MKTTAAAGFIQPILDFFFPPLCLSCGERRAPQERSLCARCRSRLIRVRDADYTMCVLDARFRESGTVSSFLPLYYFEEHGVLQPVIHALKYRGMTALGEDFGAELGAALAARPEFAQPDLVIPVPLHPLKERERGYNQAEWICRGIARAVSSPIGRRIVFRARNTRTQTKLTAAERTENVCGAFTIDRARAAVLRAKTILLVDDVVTTGATIASCAGAIRAAGAARVLGAAIGVAKLHDAAA